MKDELSHCHYIFLRYYLPLEPLLPPPENLDDELYEERLPLEYDDREEL